MHSWLEEIKETWKINAMWSPGLDPESKISETANEIQIRSRVNNITLMLIFCFENYTVIIQDEMVTLKKRS